MTVKWRAAIVFCVLLVVSACTKWGTMEEAHRLFTEKRQRFEQIVRVVRAHRELRDINNVQNPYESTEFIWKHGEFTEATKAAYMDVVGIIEELELRRVVVHRFPSVTGEQMEIISFVVFDRGFGPSSEGIVIERVEGPDPLERSQSEETYCRPIEPPVWHVCHSR